MSAWKAETAHEQQLESLVSSAPWILRITEWVDRPPPLFIVKERVPSEDAENGAGRADSHLQERGLLYGEAQRRCMPILKQIVKRVRDSGGIPLELERYLAVASDGFQGNLPLDAEAGTKLALIFKLRERVDVLDRVELIARRVDRFTSEEASYWHSRITHFGEAQSRWAQAGMRLMLGGQPGDPAIDEILTRLRSTGRM